MSTPNFVNRTLFQGDNLDYLRLLESESVDLIATDPPFNKGRDFHADPKSLKKDKSGGSFVDRWSWKDNVQDAWLDELDDTNLITAIRGVRDTHSDAMGAYLCYMAVRLLSMRRVLKPTGSIFLHCDPTASHYLKMIMDAIFGYKNFKNEIIWSYQRWTGATKHFQKMHDVILFYAMSEDSKFNILKEPYSEKSKHKGARYSKVVDGKVLEQTYTGDTSRTKAMRDVWEISYLNSQSKERKDAKNYPTQKPLKLYKRIISSVTDKGDVVLDPFCGCATTLIAAETTGREWIGIDLWEEVYDTVEHRLVNMKGVELEGSSGLKKREGELPMFDLGKITKITDTSQIENPYRGEPASPYQESIVRYNVDKEPWQKIPKGRMVLELAYNEQISEKKDEAYCGGCGRSVYHRFMQLDHINPKADGGANDLSNRILLCPPCNNIKKDHRTIRGLWDYNKKNNWMHDKKIAERTREAVKNCHLRVKNMMTKNGGVLPPLNIR